ncbi:hypothetical protein P9112_000645 [Eukaryota sp. TZLM1-RC]
MTVPETKKSRGRKKGSKPTCSFCHVSGHTIRSCSARKEAGVSASIDKLSLDSDATLFSPSVVDTPAPADLNASRLIALEKPGGDSYASFGYFCFRRIKSISINFFRPFQFAIGVPDGTTCASLSANFLFHRSASNFLLSIDYKNAFNSVFRHSIYDQLQLYFPELLPYFRLLYGTPSSLVFDSFTLTSARGVKQGEPLGPFFFCLALHFVFLKFKERHPHVDLCAYADDSSLIGSLDDFECSVGDFVELSRSIGLDINFKKCFLIGRVEKHFSYDGQLIKFVNYNTHSFKFLCTYFSDKNDILEILNDFLDNVKSQLQDILDLGIKKYLAFAVLSFCFNSKINHFLRSIPPSITESIAQRFDSIKTNFLACLVEINPSTIPYRAFFSVSLGGVGFSRADYLCKSDYIGGFKNFLFEFNLRFQKVYGYLLNENSWSSSLSTVIQELPIEVWNKCFPSKIDDIPERSVDSLRFSVVKLQNSILHSLEDLDFAKRLSVTKSENPVFAAFLIALQQSSALITQQPRPFGLHLDNDAWKINMRLGLGLFPSELLVNSVCCCVKRTKADFKHIVSCKKFLQFRSILHNSVLDVTYEMFRCHGFNGKTESLLKHYSDNDIFNCRRGDLIVPFTNSFQAVVDFTIVDPCAKVYLSSVFNDENSHLCQAEARKNQLYDEVMRNLNQNLYSSFVFIPF